MKEQERNNKEPIDFEKMMASHLPPRSEIHKKKKRTKEGQMSRRMRRRKRVQKVAKTTILQEAGNEVIKTEQPQDEPELRRSKSNKTIEKRPKYILIRFLAFIFILLPIVIAIIYFYKELYPGEKSPFNRNEDSYEHVEFESQIIHINDFTSKHE